MDKSGGNENKGKKNASSGQNQASQSFVTNQCMNNHQTQFSGQQYNGSYACNNASNGPFMMLMNSTPPTMSQSMGNQQQQYQQCSTPVTSMSQPRIFSQ